MEAKDLAEEHVLELHDPSTHTWKIDVRQTMDYADFYLIHPRKPERYVDRIGKFRENTRNPHLSWDEAWDMEMANAERLRNHLEKEGL